MKRPDTPPSALLLDSGGGWFGERAGGGCLFFGKPDFTIFSGASGAVSVSGGEAREITGDPVREIERKVSEGRAAVGFFGYEHLKNCDDGACFSGLRRRKKTAVFETPVLGFHFYPAKSVAAAKKPLAETRSLICGARGNSPEFPPRFSGDLISRKRRFLKAAGEIKSRIADGEVYQVNLSGAEEFPAPENPADFFMRFFDSQPVPFAAYMDFGSFQFLSGSMELFLAKTGDAVVSRPIKGTARRGRNSGEDFRIRAALAADEKEKAEILMITDLMRNDLARICVPSSVRTRGVFRVREYKTLFQMESEVRGILRKNVTVSEIIKKTFPPGSVTGAPKAKAVEIIESLEPHSRGPYCGAAGIFYPNGDFCLNVSIRCMAVSAPRAVCWSGAGIVWDSDPEKEFAETELKLRALRNAAGN